MNFPYNQNLQGISYPQAALEDVAAYQNKHYDSAEWIRVSDVLSPSFTTEHPVAAAFRNAVLACQAKHIPLPDPSSQYLVDFMPAMEHAETSVNYQRNVEILRRVMAANPGLDTQLTFLPPAQEELRYFRPQQDTGKTLDPTMFEGASGMAAVVPATHLSFANNPAALESALFRALVHNSVHYYGFRYMEKDENGLVLGRRGWFAHGMRCEDGEVRRYVYEGKGLDEAVTVFLEESLIGKGSPALANINRQMTDIALGACAKLAEAEGNRQSAEEIMRETLVAVYNHSGDLASYLKAQNAVEARFTQAFQSLGMKNGQGESLTFADFFQSLDEIAKSKYALTDATKNNYRVALAKLFARDEMKDGGRFADGLSLNREAVTCFLKEMHNLSRDYIGYLNIARQLVGMERIAEPNLDQIRIPQIPMSELPGAMMARTIRPASYLQVLS